MPLPAAGRTRVVTRRRSASGTGVSTKRRWAATSIDRTMQRPKHRPAEAEGAGAGASLPPPPPPPLGSSTTSAATHPLNARRSSYGESATASSVTRETAWNGTVYGVWA